MSAEGYKNDAPASIVNDSTALTLESIISILKAIKNLQIDIKAGAANQTTLATMASDIALMKIDLAAIRAILES
jgi:hypothetical protein